MEAGVRSIPAALGREPLRWHLVLWDPWWLLGGILFAGAAWQYTRKTGSQQEPGRGR
jgi:hypothetical protein